MTPIPPLPSPAWSLYSRRAVALVCFAFILIALWGIHNAVPIIIVATILSYLFYPLAALIDRRALGGRRRGLAVLGAFVLAMALFALLILIVVPPLVSQLREFAVRLPSLLQTFEAGLEQTLSQPIFINNQRIVPMDSLREALGTAGGDPLTLQSINIGDTARVFLGSLTGPAFGVLGRAFTILINLLFILTMMFYLIKDGGDFVGRIIRLTPESHRGDVTRLLRELGKVWNAYLRGQIILSVVMGVVTFIAAVILGLPNALVLGLLAAMFEFIPNLGPLLALIPAALLALATPSSTLPIEAGPTYALIVVVVWVGLQNLESIFLVPRIMGGNLNLHPFVVIVGVIAGAEIAGPLGVILAAPALSSLRVVGQYVYGKLTDRDPFPLEDEPHPPPPSVAARIRGAWAALTGASRSKVQ